MTGRAMRRWIVGGLLLFMTATAFAGGGDDSAKDAKNAKNAAELEMKFGVKAARRGYWQEALTRFQRADSLTPNNPEILNNVAVALEAVARYDDALAIYERALSLDPNDQNLRRNLMFFEEFYETYVAPAKEMDEAEAGDEAEAEEDEKPGS